MPNPTLISKYFKRYNSTASAWEYFSFITKANDVIETTSKKFATTTQLSFLDSFINGTLLYTLDREDTTATYQKGKYYVDNNTGNVYLCVSDLQPDDSDYEETTGGASYLKDEIFDPALKNVGVLSTKIDSRITNAIESYNNTLITNNKIKLNLLPDQILGQLVYGGTVKKHAPDAQGGTVLYYYTLTFSQAAKDILTARGVSTVNNTKDLLSITSSDIPTYEGMYFIVETGTNVNVSSSNSNYYITEFEFNNTHYAVGDWLIATDTEFKKIDNTDAVRTVNGRISDVKIYVGSFYLTAEGAYGVTYNDFPARNKGDIWCDGSTDTLYINIADWENYREGERGESDHWYSHTPVDLILRGGEYTNNGNTITVTSFKNTLVKKFASNLSLVQSIAGNYSTIGDSDAEVPSALAASTAIVKLRKDSYVYKRNTSSGTHTYDGLALAETNGNPSAPVDGMVMLSDD